MTTQAIPIHDGPFIIKKRKRRLNDQADKDRSLTSTSKSILASPQLPLLSNKVDEEQPHAHKQKLELPGGRNEHDTVRNERGRVPTKSDDDIAKITDDTLLTFFNGIALLNQQDSWFSTTTLQQKFIDLIHWHDGLGKKWSDCATKYMAKGYSSSDKPVSSAYLNKVYCEYARQFYPEKGLRFIPLKDRYTRNVNILNYKEKLAKEVEPEEELDSGEEAVSDNGLNMARTAGNRGREVAAARAARKVLEQQAKEDENLRRCLQSRQRSAVSSAGSSSAGKGKQSGFATTQEALDDEVRRFKITPCAAKILSFKSAAGNVNRDHPSRPVVPLLDAIRVSPTLNYLLNTNSGVDTVEYTDDVDDVTVARWIACIAPDARPSLPIYHLVEMVVEGQTKVTQYAPINWTMGELKQLYLFGHSMDAQIVSDLVIDFWLQELRGSQACTMESEPKKPHSFNIMEFDPAFVNFLAEEDSFGFRFVTDLMVHKGEETWTMMNAYGVHNYSQKVKDTLVVKVEEGEELVLLSHSVDAHCKAYHHHASETPCFSQQPLKPTTTPTSALRQQVLTPAQVDELRRKLWATAKAKGKATVVQTAPNSDSDPEWESDSSDSTTGDWQDGDAIIVGLPEAYIKVANRIEHKHDPEKEESTTKKTANATANEVLVPATHKASEKAKLAKKPAAPEESEVSKIPSPSPLPFPNRILYADDALNGISATAEQQREQLRQVKAALTRFEDFGYNTAAKKFCPTRGKHLVQYDRESVLADEVGMGTPERSVVNGEGKRGLQGV